MIVLASPVTCACIFFSFNSVVTTTLSLARSFHLFNINIRCKLVKILNCNTPLKLFNHVYICTVKLALAGICNSNLRTRLFCLTLHNKDILEKGRQSSHPPSG